MSDQGSLFDIGSVPRQGPSVSRGPQPQAEQLQMKFPSRFADSGIGHFVNRNANGLQFNKPAVKQAVSNVVEAHTRGQYFRRAGMGAALRYTLGMGQVPSHMTDYLNARTHGQRQTGINPGALHTIGQEPEA
jgi:hypothetical protein